jgi:hypothetical protein
MSYIDGNVCVFYSIQVNGKERTPPPSLQLIEFEHDFDDEKLPEATFKFYNHDQRLELAQFKPFLRDGNIIKFTYGYLGQLSPLYEYEMKLFEGFEEIKVVCYPHLPDLQKTQQRTFKDQTYSQVATKFAQELHLEPDVETTKEKYKTIQQENESRAKFLIRKAREFHFIFAIDGKRLVWRPRRYDLAPDLSFAYKTGSPEGLVSFKPKQNTFQIPAGYELSGRDKKTGKIETTNSGVNDTKRTLLGGSDSIMEMGADGTHKPGRPTNTQKRVTVRRGE